MAVWRFRAAIAAVLVAGTSVVLAAPQPASSATATVSVALPSQDQEIAAGQLARDWHVTVQEARARIARQAAAGDLAANVGRRLGSAFAGEWIDQAQGGAVVVQVTRTDPAVKRLADAYPGKVRVELVRYGLAELAAVNTAVSNDLVRLNAGSKTPMSAWVDIPRNRVVVATISGRRVEAGQRTWLKAVTARYRGRVALGTYRGPGQASGCQWPSCDDPLRAGLWIAEGSPSAGYCTSGFTALSRVDGVNYLITAGHCVAGYSGVWIERMPKDNAWHNIGYRWTWRFGSEGDMAIIRIGNAPGWNSMPWVYVRSSPGPEYPTTENASYVIDSVGGWEDIPYLYYPEIPGRYVCHTGATIGTSCGRLDAVGVTFSYDGQTVPGLARVWYTACQGDSGGPVYVSHEAFGIQVAQGPTDFTRRGPNGATQNCTAGPSYYQGILATQNTLHVDVRTGYAG